MLLPQCRLQQRDTGVLPPVRLCLGRSAPGGRPLLLGAAAVSCCHAVPAYSVGQEAGRLTLKKRGLPRSAASSMAEAPTAWPGGEPALMATVPCLTVMTTCQVTSARARRGEEGWRGASETPVIEAAEGTAAEVAEEPRACDGLGVCPARRPLAGHGLGWGGCMC